MLAWLMIIVGTVFLDQLSKWLTVINLDLHETFPIIENVLHFTYVRNTGAAFGILKDHRWVFLIVSTVAIIAMTIYLWKSRKGNKVLCVALSFIVGGGVGNMIDRTLLGYVIDFIDFRLINFAVFNIADSFVCVGVGLFALVIILDEIKAAKLSKQTEVLAEEAEENNDEKESIEAE